METRPGSEMGKVAVAVGAVAMLAAEPGEDAFPKLFRFCQQSGPSTADLGGVTDFLAAQAAQGTGHGAPRVVKSQLNVSPTSDHDVYRTGLQLASKWRAYGLQAYPGFIFIPNPSSQATSGISALSSALSYIPGNPMYVTWTNMRLGRDPRFVGTEQRASKV